MGASSVMSVVACCLLAGCGGAAQVGLANAPGLGGTSPETRVHDVTANGRDACERAMFPPGAVLRGQVPPCGKESLRTAAWAPPPPSTEPMLQLSYPIGYCPTRPRPHNAGMEKGLAAFSLSPPQLWPTCEPPETLSPADEGGLRLKLTSPVNRGRPWIP
jgi:hypothetical protein